MIRKYLSCALAAAVVGAALSAAHAQVGDALWIAPGTEANWNDGSNWDITVIPEFFIAGGGPSGEDISDTAVFSGGLGGSNATAIVTDVIDSSGSPGTFNGPGALRVEGPIVEIRSGASLTVMAGPLNTGASEFSFTGTLNVIGDGTFQTDSLSTATNGRIQYNVTSASQYATAPVSVGAGARLGGQLFVDFADGRTLSLGEVVNVIDAGSVQGSFAGITVTGQADLPVGQQYGISRNAGGNGTILGLTVLQKPILRVNLGTGSVLLDNVGNLPVELDGFSIQSAGGVLDHNAFSGLGAGWITSGSNGPTQITQLRDGGIGQIAAQSSTDLGVVYTPPTPPLGQFFAADVQLLYTAPGLGTIEGVVQYEGQFPVSNHFILSIDSNTGVASVMNDSTQTIEMEGYTIASALGLMDDVNWDSLEAQGFDGDVWVASASSNNDRLSELTQEQGSGSTITPGGTFDLGKIYNVPVDPTASDLTFEILLSDPGQPPTVATGMVQFTDTGGVDADGDGDVDGADFLLLQIESPGSIPDWEAAYGTGILAAASAGVVPEPGSAVLAMAAAAAAIISPRRRSANACDRERT